MPDPRPQSAAVHETPQEKSKVVAEPQPAAKEKPASKEKPYKRKPLTDEIPVPPDEAYLDD
jgi:hypothetical protein